MIRNLFTYLLSALFLTAVVSCSSNQGVLPDVSEPDSEPKVILSLRVVMDNDNHGRSRADKGPDGYEPPVGDFETVSTLRVIILHGDGDLRTVEASRLVSTTPAGVPLHDNLEFKLKAGELKTIYLIANERSLTSPAPYQNEPVSQFLDRFFATKNKVDDVTLNLLNNWTASIKVNDAGYATESFLYADADSRLPLTEVFTINTIKAADIPAGSGTSYTQEANLFMTRAAAKATFIFKVDDDPENPFAGSGVNVTGIRLCGISRAEYVFPRDATYNPAKYKDGTLTGLNQVSDDEASKRYITSFAAPATTIANFTIPLGDRSFELKSMAGVAEEKLPTFGPVYFPESKVPAPNDNFSVQVQLDNGDWLDAQPLTTNILDMGGYDAIARNTHLKVYIYFEGAGIKCDVKLVPYGVIELEPVFGIDYNKKNQQGS